MSRAGESGGRYAGALELLHGDLTGYRVDVIVNAANRSLLGGGGGVGAIQRAAGPELKAECWTLDSCKTGEAKLTRGYKLRSLAFPSISTGVYGFLVTRAARIALQEIQAGLAANPQLGRVTVVCFSDGDLSEYKDALKTLEAR